MVGDGMDIVEQVHSSFTLLDWGVIIGYLALTTIVGHLMRGKQGTIRDFFLGGRSLPWPAVSGSMIATEISGVTFIGVAGGLFALHGNFTYLLWAIGSIMARVIVAKYFIPRFFEEEIYSPYDYMGRRIGMGAKKLATVVFSIGSILGQSVRVLVAAIPLQIVTGLNIFWCISIIGVLAICWTLMGGMRTVIWTDVMQFVLFTFGGLLALFWIVGSLDGGFTEYWGQATVFARTDIWNDTLKANVGFTIWVAILAVPFQNLTSFGVDQLNTQRMFCCKDAKSASKALIWSSTSQVLTLLMLLVGAALVVHYDKTPFKDQEVLVLMNVKGNDKESVMKARAEMEKQPFILSPAAEEERKAYVAANPDDKKAKDFSHEGLSNVREPKNTNAVFPMWIVTVLPAGLSGLILAGVFAAAISSLDSILAALSQTTLSLLYHPENKSDEELEKLNLLSKSRKLVVIWGVVLTVFTFGIAVVPDSVDILALAFGMTSYTVGPLLAIFFCALMGKGSVRGLSIGFAISFIMVMFTRTDIWGLVEACKIPIDWLSSLPTYSASGKGVKPTLHSAWMWPVTTFVTLICGLYLGKKSSAAHD